MLSFLLRAVRFGFSLTMTKYVIVFLVMISQAFPVIAANAPDYPATLRLISFNAGTYYADPQFACDKVSAPSATVTGMEYQLVGQPNLIGSYKCRIVYKSSGPGAWLNVGARFQCPFGGVLSPGVEIYGGMCTAVPAGGGPPPPTCNKGTQVTVTHETGTYNKATGGHVTDPSKTPPINGASDGQCEITIVDVKECVGKGDGKTYCTYVGQQTGNPLKPGPSVPATTTAAPSAAPSDTPLPVPPFTGQPGGGCPKGTVQGGVGADGVPMCMGTGSNPPKPPTVPPVTTKPPTTTTQADGTTVQTQVTSQSNSDGSTTTTTTTTTTKPDGSVTVNKDSVASSTSAGTPGKTDKPTEDQTNFCKQNPNLSICRESSVSGTCGQTACVGDAIQCATLRAAATMQCKQAEDEAALKAMPAASLGNSLLAGNDPQGADIAAALKGTEVDMSNPNLDQSGFLAGGSCFPNKSFQVMGQTVTMDLSSACSNIQPLRGVILACAFIVAYMLVSRSVLAS